MRLFPGKVPLLCAGPLKWLIMLATTWSIVHPGSLSAQESGPDDWRLSSSPLLEIGLTDGDANYVFSDIQAGILLDNGSIAVADNGSKQLRFYDSAGTFLQGTGRFGEGPGEFQWLSWIGECSADSLFVFDSVLKRVSVFTLDGAFVRSFELASPASTLVPQHLTCDRQGHLLVGTRRIIADQERGPYRTTASVWVADTEGQVSTRIGRFPGDERYRFSRSDGPRALGRRTVQAIGGDRIFVGTGDSFRIRVYVLDGDALPPIVVEQVPRPITDADIDRFIEEQVAGIDDPDQRRFRYRQWEELDYPAVFPPYSDLRVDSDGNLWVRTYPIPGDEMVRWRIFDPQGTEVARLDVPEQLSILHATEEHVLGRWTDDLGVEYVRLYALEKGVE